jgi:uncharacterized protein (TIGR03067 family)
MKGTMKRIIALSVLAFAGSVWAADDDADSKKWQGTWTPVSAELGGVMLPPQALKAITLKIDGENYDVTVLGENASDRGTTKLDAKASPKTMTITSTNGPNKGKTFLAIYEFKGEAPRVCYDLSGTKRPTEFKTEPGTKLYLVTYQRK